jgi:hypothetical protein
MGGTKAQAISLKSYITLDRYSEIPLNTAATAEIELYQQLDTLIGFLKIRAYFPIEW